MECQLFLFQCFVSLNFVYLQIVKLQLENLFYYLFIYLLYLNLIPHYFCHRVDTSCSGSIKSYECGSTLWNLDYLPDVSLNRVLSQKTRSITLQLKGRIVVRNIDKQHIDLFSFIGLRPCDYY